MRRFSFFLLLALPFLLSAQQPITLEDIWQKGTFATKSVPGFNFQNDGVHYTRLVEKRIEQYDLRTGGQTAIIFDATTVTLADSTWKGSFDGYSFSADETKILLTTQQDAIFRYSSQSQYFVFDMATKKLTRLFDGAKQQHATFSPNGSRVGFVVNNDLYFKDFASGKTTRVTTDGKKNNIINGASDWVYEEEFELVRAFDWSPDGQRLAFLRFDESAVPKYILEMYKNKEYPLADTIKYPKVGQPNAIVTAWSYNITTGKTAAVQTGSKPDDYLPRIGFTPAGKICLTWMNRHQNELKLLLADPITGVCTTLLEEKNKYYLDLQDVTFLKDGSGFIMQSEKSGFNHLYQYDMSGKEVEAITKGKWDVTGFYGVDEKNGLAYFQAAAENPMQREVYRVKLNGKGRKSFSKEEGTNAAQFSSTYDYYINTYSTINKPPSYAVFDREGKFIRSLEENDKAVAVQQQYAPLPVAFFDFKTSEDVSLNGWMIRPTGPQYKDQKLPVLMFVYGGPGSQQVLDQWKGSNYWWFQMLAQQGYVVACVDNRGTGARGEEFKKMTYKQLGHYEVMDQIEAAKYLGKQSFIDQDRIGIFGWSYGGYMASLCILKGHDVFKSAIAVAPVTNWKWYDSVYTERYMQTHEENPDGYEQNSPTNFADQLSGNFLLIHGLADDNVHFQHSAELSNKLIAANKQFDAMVYPNRNHGIYGDNARLHLYTLMTNFLAEKLKAGKKP